MARPKDTAAADLPLPRGLFRHHRQYRARRSHDHPWQYFGTDYAEAMRGYAAWKASGGVRDGVAWMLDVFTAVVCPAKVRAGQLAPRTARDYARDAVILKRGLGHFGLRQLEPQHIAVYRNARAQDAPSHVRNEMACLSAACSYAVEIGKLAANPCLEVKRPRKVRRERLITHDEYLAVYAEALPSVRVAMVLALRTLALPGDLLAMGPRNIVKTEAGRVLRYQRAKTRTPIEIEVVGELARVVDEALAVKVVRSTFVYGRNGEPYTVDGIGAMFRRYCGKEKASVADFGLRDLRAKGATDMYRSGVAIRQLSALLGHKSEATTRIYIKGFIPETVRPNETAVVSGAC
jgi:integrase